MYIKATSYMARKTLITRKFGQERWDDFNRRLGERVPFFKQPIYTTTRIPADAFLPFCDFLLTEFYDGDVRAYFSIGEAAGEWALTEGPYKMFLENRDPRSFVLKSAPTLWTTYFSDDQGTLLSEIQGRVVHFRSKGLTLKHPYFEYVPVAYFKRGLELFGLTVGLEKVQSSLEAASDFHYRLPVDRNI